MGLSYKFNCLALKVLQQRHQHEIFTSWILNVFGGQLGQRVVRGEGEHAAWAIVKDDKCGFALALAEHQQIGEEKGVQGGLGETLAEGQFGIIAAPQQMRQLAALDQETWLGALLGHTRGRYGQGAYVTGKFQLLRDAFQLVGLFPTIRRLVTLRDDLLHQRQRHLPALVFLGIVWRLLAEHGIDEQWQSRNALHGQHKE